MKRILLMIVVSLLWGATAQAATCTATTSGAWTDPAIWSCGHVPNGGSPSFDNVIIAAGVNVTGTSLTSLDFVNLTVYGNLTLSGSLSYNQTYIQIVTVKTDGVLTITGDLSFSSFSAGSGFVVENGGELYLGGQLTDGNVGVINFDNFGFVEITGNTVVKQLVINNKPLSSMLVHGNMTGSGSSGRLNNEGIITTDLTLSINNLIINNFSTGRLLVFGDIIMKGSGTFVNQGFIQTNSFDVQNMTGFTQTGTLVVLDTLDEDFGGCPCNGGDAYIDPAKITVNNNPAASCGGNCKDRWIATSIKPRLGSKLWYSADMIGVGQNNDNDLIKRWFDLSNNYGLYMQSTTSNAPALRNNSADNINFNPVVSFSGSKYLDLGSRDVFSTAAEAGASMFAVVVPKTGGTGRSLIFDFGQNAAAGYGLGYTASNAYTYTPTASGGGEISYARTPADNQAIVLSTATTYGAGKAQYLFLNGILRDSVATNLAQLGDVEINQGTLPTYTHPFTLGMGASKVGNDFEGNVAEVVFFGRSLSNSERKGIESLLALKYGITLPDVPYTDFANHLIWPVDATYRNEIAGIGREDINFLNQKKSKSSSSTADLTISIDTILNATYNQKSIATAFGDNSTFLVWGSNGRSIVSGLKKYKIVATNFNQKVYLQFNIAGLSSPYPKLIIDDDPNFASPNATLTATGYVSSSYLTFNYTFTNNATMYFRLDMPSIAPGYVTNGLELWMSADSGPLNTSLTTATNTQEIARWTDRTGLLADKPATAGLAGPIFLNNTTSNMNYNPVAQFDGSTTTLNFGSSYIYSSAGLTFLGVAKPSATINKTRQFVLDFGIYQDLGYGVGIGDSILFAYTSGFSNGLTSSYTMSQNTKTSLFGMKADIAGKQQDLYMNGIIASSSSPATYLPSLGDAEIGQKPVEAFDGGPVTIGMQSKTDYRNLNGFRAFKGLLPEISLWSRPLSAIERQRVETYFAIKYGVTIPKDYICSDGTTVIWNRTSNALYHNAVAGILKDNNSGLLQKQSKNENDIIAIGLTSIASTNALNTGTFPADKSALVWGHNGEDTIPVLSGKPASVPAIMKRVWKVAETGGDLGTVQVAVSISGGTGSAANYYLVVDNDNNGSFETVVNCSSVSGSVYYFSFNPANNCRFTFGRPALPVNTQSPGVGINTTSIDPSAHLHVESNSSGVLLSAMTDAEMKGITSPSKGLIVYNTSYNCYMYNAGTATTPAWTAVGSLIKQASHEMAASIGNFAGELRYNISTKTVWFWDGTYWNELK